MKNRARTMGAGVIALCMIAVPAAGQAFKDRPHAIVCNVLEPESGVIAHALFYLDLQLEGGITRYSTLGTRTLQLRVRPDGSIEDNKFGDCAGKNLKQLEQDGQTITFRQD